MKVSIMNRVLVLAPLLGALSLLGACAGAEKNPDATGGKGSGGASGSGGAAGSGGSPTSGGTAGTAGTPTSGGTAGSGGTPASGGSAGSSGSGAGVAHDPDCDKDGFICNPSGFPFVQAAIVTSSLCGGLVADCDLAKNPPAGAATARLTQPVPGKLCMEGSIPSGGAGLFLKLAREKLLQVNPNGARDVKVLQPFDATSLGITQVDFTIDSPIVGAFGMVATTTTPNTPVNCPDQGLACVPFWLFTPGSGMNTTFTLPGPQVAPLTHFESEGGESFDTTALEDLRFYTVVMGDYSWCISDLKFRNAAGAEVKP